MSGARHRRQNLEEVARAAACYRPPRTVREFLATEGRDGLSLELVAAAIAGYAATAGSELADRFAGYEQDEPEAPWRAATGPDLPRVPGSPRVRLPRPR